MIIQMNKNSLGSFKTNLIKVLKDLKYKVYNNLTYNSGSYIVNRYKLKEEDNLIIIQQSTKKGNLGLEYILLNRPNTRIVNPSLCSYYTKPELQFICETLSIPTPKFGISNEYRGFNLRGDFVRKPNRGQGGSGVRLLESKDKARYGQKWISPPLKLGTVFDVRINVFLGEYLCGNLRILHPKLVQKKSKKFWGLTNTCASTPGEEAKMHYFDENLRPCYNEWSQAPYEKIIKWLGTDHPKDEWIRWARQIAEKIGLNYIGIDIIFDKQKRPYVIDINPNPACLGKRVGDKVKLRRAIQILQRQDYINEKRLPEAKKLLPELKME